MFISLPIKQIFRRGRNSPMTIKPETHSVHIVDPQGQISRLQLAPQRSFPQLELSYAYDERGERPIAIHDADLKHPYRAAGYTLLAEDYADEGNTAGYEAYCRWEAHADTLKNASHTEKRARIPDVTEHLPASVLARRESRATDLDFGFPARPEKSAAGRKGASK